MIRQTTQPEQERIFTSKYYFSRLPAELRWKIWEYNLPNPRLVSIRCGSDDLGCCSPSNASASASAADGRGRRPSPFRLAASPTGCTSPARIPANLHACHEARREALRHYRPSFGLAHGPGQIMFAPAADILYFGPRDGFMAAEAQLRTVLTLCDPAELARVRKMAVNDAVFWSPAPPHTSTAEGCHQQRMVASSLLVDVLRLLRARMPGLRELVFVPRDENPLYSGDACLVEPTMAQSRLARVVREAMGVVFPPSSAADDARPWDWKIMTLSADADVPVYGRQVLGWTASAEDEMEMEYGNAHGPGYSGSPLVGRGFRRGGGEWGDIRRHWAAGGRDSTGLSVLQESVRRQFMQMEMGGARAVPVLVE